MRLVPSHNQGLQHPAIEGGVYARDYTAEASTSIMIGFVDDY